MFFCPKCAEAIPDGSTVCPKCNAVIVERNGGEQAVVYASQAKVEQQQPLQEAKAVKKTKPIKIIAAIVLIVIVAIFGINEIQKNSLRNELQRGWYGINDDATLLLVLDFSDNKIEYKVETGIRILDTTIATYDYKVISGSKIQIDRYGYGYETFKLEFNDDKSMFTVTPAITSLDSEEYWYNLD